MRARNAAEEVGDRRRSFPGTRDEVSHGEAGLKHGSQSTLRLPFAEPFPTFDRLRVGTSVLLVQRASPVMRGRLGRVDVLNVVIQRTCVTREPRRGNIERFFRIIRSFDIVSTLQILRHSKFFCTIECFKPILRRDRCRHWIV